MTANKVLEDLIKAWESLPGNAEYPPRIIEKWLVQDMTPAIMKARSWLRNHPRKK